MAYVTLKRVDPMSYGKIEAVFAAIVGFVYGIFAGFILGTLGILGGSTIGISGWLAIAMPFVGLIGGGILGFIFAAISAIIYNLIAGAIGGIRISLGSKPTIINSIDRMSLAKIVAVGALIVSVIIAIILVAAFPVIIGTIGGLTASGPTASRVISELQGVSGAVEIMLLVIIPIVGIVAGFIYGFLYALVYDFLAGKIGGIKFTLSGKQTVITGVDPMSYAKMSASIAAIIAFITSLFDFLVHHSIASAVGVIGIPIFDFVVGFVVTYIFAWVYNTIAPRIGGIQIVLK